MVSFNFMESTKKTFVIMLTTIKRKIQTARILWGRQHFGFIKQYAKWIDNLHNDKSYFVPYTQTPYVRKESDVKIFAYYLTQFHAIPENDKAYGKGFTEWTNVAACTPQYLGHEQPKIPYDLGFYNLLMPGVMERQAQMAKDYGVYGWCFYYYWFSGKKALEKPLEYFLNSDIDIHFHLCWANENWSKLWDGGDKEVIFEQKYKQEDAVNFFHDILPYLQDKRYERIEDKPVLMIYRPQQMSKDYFAQFIQTLQIEAINNGFKGLYITESGFSEDNPLEIGLQARTEFRPQGMWMAGKKVICEGLSNNVKTNIYNIEEYIHKKEYISEEQFPIYKCCFPSWDNSPRKAYSGGYCFLMNATLFKEWLIGCIQWTQSHHDQNHQYVYINAWNEWAEGAILEPTTRRGYESLQIVKESIEETRL